MGYRGGYLCGFYFAVDMFRFDAVTHKYQRGNYCVITNYFYLFFRVVVVDDPAGLQFDDQVATFQMVRSLTEFNRSFVPFTGKQGMVGVTCCTPLNSIRNSAALSCIVLRSSLASSIALRFR